MGEAKAYDPLDKGLTWFINGWTALVVLFNTLIMLVLIVSAPVQGFLTVLGDLLSIHYWITDWIMPMIPAIAAIGWRERRRTRPTSDIRGNHGNDRL
jgi:hypothetical protein